MTAPVTRTPGQLAPRDIEARLRALADDLAEFPPGVACAWPVSRVFNELLKQVKREREEDPVVATIAFLRDAPTGGETPAPVVQIGTVRALVGQLLVALSADGAESA